MKDISFILLIAGGALVILAYPIGLLILHLCKVDIGMLIAALGLGIASGGGLGGEFIIQFMNRNTDKNSIFYKKKTE